MALPSRPRSPDRPRLDEQVRPASSPFRPACSWIRGDLCDIHRIHTRGRSPEGVRPARIRTANKKAANEEEADVIRPLLIITLLLSSVATASAECAWVLWSDMKISTDGAPYRPYSVKI